MLDNLPDLIDLIGMRDYLPYLHWISQHRLGVGLGAGAAAIPVMAGVAKLTKRTPRMIYGDAHFATVKELRKHHLDTPYGIYVGRMHGVDVRVPRCHMITIGGSEVGKTVSIGVGSEIEWPGSVFTIDIKGDYVRLSAPYRAKRGPVHVIEPRSESSAKTNLLDKVSWGKKQEIQIIDRITDHLTFTEATTSSREAIFYRDSNRRLMKAALLYEGNFAGGPVVSFASTWTRMGQTFATLTAMSKVDHPHVAPIAQNLLKLRAEQREQLWGSARNCLEIFGDPIISENTDTSTVDLDSLQFGERPQTVYIRVNPDDARGPLKPLVRLWLDDHIATAGARREITKFRWHEKVRLDDQYELGYLAAADHIPSFYRAHGLWLDSYFQSFKQLKDYNSHTGLLDNSKTWVVFKPNDTDSAEVVSKKLGKTTVFEKRITSNGGRRTTTMIPHERNLMTVYEVGHIPNFHAFVFSSASGPRQKTSAPPIFAQQIPYTDRHLQ